MFVSFLKKPMAVVIATGRPTRLPFTQEVFDGICPENRRQADAGGSVSRPPASTLSRSVPVQMPPVVVPMPPIVQPVGQARRAPLETIVHAIERATDAAADTIGGPRQAARHSVASGVEAIEPIGPELADRPLARAPLELCLRDRR
jgi:hypothetical protein